MVRPTKCEQCGKKLPKPKSAGKPRRFCDAKCSQKYWIERHPRIQVGVGRQSARNVH